MYKLSPSSLTFLYDECPRCFWLHYKGWKRPFSPFPSVFGKIDKAMRSFYHGQMINEIVPSLPPGRIDTTERKITSKPLTVMVGDRPVQVQFSGKMDCLVRFDDGSVGAIDFKTSEAKEAHLAMYWRQLQAYTDILQNPDKGKPERVSHMGLIPVTPSLMRLDTNGQAVFEMTVSYQEVAIDHTSWSTFLTEVVTLLEHPDPPGKDNCFYCAMHRATTGHPAPQMAEAST